MQDTIFTYDDEDNIVDERAVEVIVLGEDSIVAQVDGLDGVVNMYVLNGAWDGILDWDNGVYWPNLYPDMRIPFKSWRHAVRGQDQYYD